MEIFEFILLMLAAIALSNLLNRFIPSVSVPIIQIALGVGITYLPLHFELRLNPELFLLLFIAPLLFNDGRHSDKEALWSLKKPILLLALGLVFMTVAILGFFLNWLLPVIPLAASFALAAALAPTDAIAVGALEEKIQIPHQTMKILEGESLINDASGLVSFQFAAAAMVTGAFSLRSASLSFVGISIGGIVLGLLLTLVKYVFVKWLRRLGMENVTLHMLIEVLTPFAVFLAAEELGVNGILAAVSAGIAHSFGYKKLDPEVARLNIVSKSTWSVIIYVLNGLVFLLLGTQLPEIIRTIWSSSSLGHVQVFTYTLVLTLAVLSLRFIWILFMKLPGSSEQMPVRGHKIKNALILSLSGVRGTITLASTLSLPFLLDNGNPFPERDLIIFLAAGVILWTLLAANYLLPLLIKNEGESENDESHIEIEILRNVVIALSEQTTDENRAAISKIISTYNSRIRKLKKEETADRFQRPIIIQTLKWQRENTLQAIQNKEVNPFIAYRYLHRLNRTLYRFTKDEQYRTDLMALRQWMEVSGILQQARLTFQERHAAVDAFQIRNIHYVIVQLKNMLPTAGAEIEDVSSLLLRYEGMLGRYTRNESEPSAKEDFDTALDELARVGIQLERDQIQHMFESGKLSRAGMKGMKSNLLLMEHDLRELTL
ncbi:Na+/H+ antiporter [Paenibacillus jilunlii]|uniref:Sodium/proton antiporter, CPA1 family n=1 Tax=Paenibacillus jilunlii TaxID=682956 RepID=A0A1G9YDL2_9BACL|nr:Na+/H+ antiporter [Paenibacillus jilunlii]KWX78763.1 sodium:proton antiporter [Paenibacillus jilunlii]SDN07252.1 sodium/proton antiporter, CPA1 family [Paenibacillus jilunlii]